MSNNAEPLKVLVYSDDRTVRAQIRLALGRRLAADLPEVELVEVATGAAALRTLDTMPYDAVIFDGEAVPIGGMGLSHQIKDEIPNCPPVLLLVARVADAWLATWSRADAISAFPVDPVELPSQLAEMIRRHRANQSEDSQVGSSQSMVDQSGAPVAGGGQYAQPITR